MLSNIWPSFLKPIEDRYYSQRVSSSFLLLLAIFLQIVNLALMFYQDKISLSNLTLSVFIVGSLCLVVSLLLLFSVIYIGRFYLTRLLVILASEGSVIVVLNYYLRVDEVLQVSLIIIAVTPFIVFSGFKTSNLLLLSLTSVFFLSLHYLFINNTAPARIIEVTPQVNNNIEIFLAFIISLYVIYAAINEENTQNNYKKIQNRLVKITNNMLPDFALKEIMSGKKQMARRFEAVTVIVVDIVDFTRITRFYDPSTLVNFLSVLFNQFDLNCEKYKCEKIKTLGDGYLAVKGLHNESPTDTVRNAVRFAFGIKHSLDMFNKINNTSLALRIGINTGDVVGGVLGTSKLTFDIWGKTVNITARLENNAETNCILMSEISYAYIKSIVKDAVERTVDIKGVGSASAYQIDLQKKIEGL